MNRPSAKAARGTILALCAAFVAAAASLGLIPGQQIAHELAPAAAAQGPAIEGRLLFTRDGGLWSLRPSDGQEPTQLVPRPRIGLILTARWAPDGSRLAYAQYEVVPERNAPVSSIYVVGADGSGARQVVVGDEPGTQLQQPAWSPDGRFIYFLHRRASVGGSLQRIERVDTTSGERVPAADVFGEVDASPDGRWLAVSETPGGRAALTLIDLRDGSRVPLIPPGTYEAIASPRFDPRSQTLLFSGLRWGDVPGVSGPPSHVGSLLGLFRSSVARAHGLPMDMYTIPVAGGTPRRLTTLMLDDPVGAWAPDGSQLAILAAEFLAIAPAAGGAPTPILTPGGYGSVDWTR